MANFSFHHLQNYLFKQANITWVIHGSTRGQFARYSSPRTCFCWSEASWWSTGAERLGLSMANKDLVSHREPQESAHPPPPTQHWKQTALLSFTTAPKWAGPPHLWQPLPARNPHQLGYSQNSPFRHVWAKDRGKENRPKCISCQGATPQLWLFILTLMKLSFPAGGPAREPPRRPPLPRWARGLPTDARAVQIQIHRPGRCNPRPRMKITWF